MTDFIPLMVVTVFLNVLFLVWFITSINTIKSRLYDIYDQVFDLRESAWEIEKMVRQATGSPPNQGRQRRTGESHRP